jgi:hypothetical protein
MFYCAALILAALPLQTMANDGLLSGYRPVELPAVNISSPNPFSLADEFLSHVNANPSDTRLTMRVESIPDEKVPEGFKSDGFIFEFELSGYLDDSVAGDNYRVIIGKVVKENKTQYFISKAGVLNICARGENTTVPQVALCP